MQNQVRKEKKPEGGFSAFIRRIARGRTENQEHSIARERKSLFRQSSFRIAHVKQYVKKRNRKEGFSEFIRRIARGRTENQEHSDCKRKKVLIQNCRNGTVYFQ
jgi:hypothetical protein